MRNTSFTGITLASLMALSSCTIDKGFVARDWSKNLRELNIQPIFPPREDIQVGDVYLLPYSQKEKSDADKSYTPIGIWVNSINLNYELKQHYSQRPDFPKTRYNKDTSSTMERQPISNGNLFSGGEVNRLKMVLLPTFFKAEISAFDATSLIPSNALGQLGIGAENIKKAFVTISSASSYGIPVSKLKSKIFENGKFCINKATGMDLASLRFTVDKAASGKKQSQKALLIIPTEVFYARTLKVQLSVDKRAEAGNTGSQNKPAGTAPQEIANKAQTSLDEHKRKTLVTPGISVNVGSSAHGAVSIDRTFERPIAIGFRGIRQIISLDKLTSEVSAQCQTTHTSPADTGNTHVPLAAPEPG